MAEFLQIDPDDLVEETMEEYSYSPGHEFDKSFFILLIFSIAGIFYSALKFSGPEGGDGQPGGTDELVILGLIFAISLLVAAFATWKYCFKKWETGSRIELLNRQFVWWDGPPPRIEHTIAIDSLSNVIFVAGEDSEATVLRMRSGEEIELPVNCVRNARDWAKVLSTRFPHVKLEDRDMSFKFWKSEES